MSTPAVPEDPTRVPSQLVELAKASVRTISVTAVAAFTSWLQQRGIVIPEWGGDYLVPVIAGLLYYVIARVAEMKLHPAFGVLLGWVGGPVYETATQALDRDTLPVLVEVPKDVVDADAYERFDPPAVAGQPADYDDPPPAPPVPGA